MGDVGILRGCAHSRITPTPTLSLVLLRTRAGVCACACAEFRCARISCWCVCARACARIACLSWATPRDLAAWNTGSVGCGTPTYARKNTHTQHAHKRTHARTHKHAHTHTGHCQAIVRLQALYPTPPRPSSRFPRRRRQQRAQPTASADDGGDAQAGDSEPGPAICATARARALPAPRCRGSRRRRGH